MSWTIIIIFLLAGVLLMLLEVLVVPGATIFGVLGFLLIGVSIWQAYAAHGTPEGHYFLAGTFVLTIVFLSFALKSKTWRRAMLDTNVRSKVNVIEESQVKAGDEGKTISRLAPAGKALLNGEYYEVHSLGEYVDPQTPIVVIRVEFNRIIVKPKN